MRQYFVNHTKRQARTRDKARMVLSLDWVELDFERYSEYVNLQGYKETFYE